MAVSIVRVEGAQRERKGRKTKREREKTFFFTICRFSFKRRFVRLVAAAEKAKKFKKEEREREKKFDWNLRAPVSKFH